MTVAILLLIQAVVFAVLSGIVARSNNRDPAGWGVLGFLFGILGFIAAIAVGEAENSKPSSRRRSSRKTPSSSKKEQISSNKDHQQSDAQDFIPDEHEKKCPDCAEYIKLEARVCKHCGHRFPDEEVKRQMEERKKEFEGSQESEKSRENVDPENPTRAERYAMNTHKFIQGESECKRCGLSKSYIVEHRYKCPYSERD